MPIPAELEGKQLRGSIWIRKIGQHRGAREKIINFNEVGVKLAPESGRYQAKHSGRTWSHKEASMQWPIFMNLYSPEGELEVIVTTDKEGFVQKVEKEVASVNGVVKPAELPPIVEVVAERLCLGPWHRKDGTGTMLPVSQFEVVQIGRYHGQLSKTCIECRAKKKEYETERLAKKEKVKVADIKPRVVIVERPSKEEPVPQPKVTMKEAVEVFNNVVPAKPPVILRGKTLTKWKVTIIPAPNPVEVEVEAEDFLGAGIAAGDGEVIRIERL